uniref:KIAA0825 n=1 Tax=Seriola lalandi dorsalis TaxID=1841481 RepID=A0A3B4Y314_SERLL
EEEKEEVTLQLLLNLSAQCGVCFPCTPSSSPSSSSLHPQLTASSSHLVHTVRDDASLEIQEAWDDVRHQLRRHLLDRLSSRSPERPGHSQISILSIPERIHCLQQLFFLYPESEVENAIMKKIFIISTGFDRLAQGFRFVIPALTQALTEELQVLSRLAEPHTILGFLNAAYLSTVARELASLVDRECEMALRDNTSLSGKIKKYSARSRATVVPMELPIKNRSFSLTSHQLRALTQLACTLLGFESNVKELVTNMTFINCTGDTPCTIYSSEVEQVKYSLQHSDINWRLAPVFQAQVLEFNWRSAFRGLVPHMEHCVKVVLDDVCAKSLQQEEALYRSGQTSVILCCTSGHNFPFIIELILSLPYLTHQFCGTIMAESDALLPLAAACRDSSLLEVRSSFVEACGRATFAMLGRVQERALEVPSFAPLKNLPALLATCIYVHQQLDCYWQLIEELPLTLLPIQKYRDTVDALKDQLTSYCVQVCSTCILQDAESHHWADPKPFYEGERCSFSVQMWFYFLCGLRSDLWAVLPAEMAKDVLGQVLSETLQLLVQRYARARASYKRHLQIRCDITAVLLYVEQLMWSLCESPEALVRSSPSSVIAIIAGGSDWPYQIHSLCEQLLTVLVIVTAPLSLLYRFVHTLCFCYFIYIPVKYDPIIPKYLYFNDQRWSCGCSYGLMGQAAFACQLRLLTSDPGRNPKLLLRMLLYRDCHLPRILLENSCKSCSLKNQGYIEVVSLIFSQAPFSTCCIYLPFLSDTTRTAPGVITCVRAVVTKSTNSLLVHLVSMVMGWQATEELSGASFKRHVPESVLAKIPKDWNYAPLEARGKETATKSTHILAIQATSFIFTNLPMAVASLPLPIRFLFQVAEKHLSQHARQLRLVGLLLWALLGCLIRGLEDPDTLEQISGLALDRGAKDRLSLLAECLQAAMGIQQKVRAKVLQALEEKRPKWTNMQLQKARKLCSDSVFERERESGVAAAELTEQKIGLMLLEVCHKAGGTEYLRQIYHIIQGNEVGKHSLSPAIRWLLSAVVDWAWDWPRLLPAYQGMSQVTFKTLLANR